MLSGTLPFICQRTKVKCQRQIVDSLTRYIDKTIMELLVREQLPIVIWQLVGYRKKENGFANMYNIVEIRNFKPTVSE